MMEIIFNIDINNGQIYKCITNCIYTMCTWVPSHYENVWCRFFFRISLDMDPFIDKRKYWNHNIKRMMNKTWIKWNKKLKKKITTPWPIPITNIKQVIISKFNSLHYHLIHNVMFSNSMKHCPEVFIFANAEKPARTFTNSYELAQYRNVFANYASK